MISQICPSFYPPSTSCAFWLKLRVRVCGLGCIVVTYGQGCMNGSENDDKTHLFTLNSESGGSRNPNPPLLIKIC